MAVNGRVVVGESRPSPTPTGLARTATRYLWHPPAEIEAELPGDFTLSIDAMVGRDGVRRFAPADGIGLAKFVVTASLGGLALLAWKKRLTAEQRFSYHAMRLVYQLAGGFREHLDRRFTRVSELYVSGAGSAGFGSHLLPDGLGLDASGIGTPWSPADLVARGRAAAAARGRDAGPAGWIRLGLYEAARLKPIDVTRLTSSECAAIVRMALFDFGPHDGPLGEGKAEAIQGRLLAAIERLDGPAFRRWLFEDLDNLVHGIAKQTSGGVRLSRPEVRQGLLDLAFDSYRYVGDCVHVQMRAFAASLPEPLTRDERLLFEAIYAKQDSLGGLPLVLLSDRFEWLREGVFGVWDSPADPAGAGALLRLLEYYGTMVRARRRGDASAKAAGQSRNRDGRPAATVGFDDARDTRPDRGDRFQEIAAELLERRGVSCACGATPSWHAALPEGGPGESHGPVLLEVTCAGCLAVQTQRFSRAEFRAAGREGV